MNFETIINIIETSSIVIASFVAIYGISSWRRETKWKRKYELAEEVLSCFYEISERFDEIRCPAGYVGEGSTRKRKDNESEEESLILDNAYVVFERYEKDKTPFIKLMSLKYRFMVLYGKEAGKPFEEILQLRNKLFSASHLLGQRYWKDQGRKTFTESQFEKHLKKMEELEAIFWADYGEKDEFKDSVNKVVTKIEAICKEIITKK